MGSIGLITTRLGHGGAERQLCQLAEDLSKLGERVFILSFMPPYEANLKRLKSAKIAVDTLDMRRGILRGIRLSMLVKYRKWVKSKEIELGIFFNYHPILVGRVSWKLGLISKVISSIRNEQFCGEQFDDGKWRERAFAFTDLWCNLNTTNSEKVADSLIDRGACSREKLRTVLNGLDFSAFENAGTNKQSLRNELGIADSDFLWLAAGRLVDQKDFGRLIKATSQLHTSHPNIKVRIAGEGEMRGELNEMIHQYEMNEVCSLIGERSDMPELLSAADGFVLPSIHEGSPNVLIEALAAGTPAVATDVSGNCEILQKESGLLIPSENTKALIDAMQRLMNQTEATRKAMGGAGRAFVRGKFSRQSALNQWLRAIEETEFQLNTRAKDHINTYN